MRVAVPENAFPQTYHWLEEESTEVVQQWQKKSLPTQDDRFQPQAVQTNDVERRSATCTAIVVKAAHSVPPLPVE